MSTTIKRVALVAVAALGLGVLSVAPSTAAVNNDTLTVSAATAAQTTAETVTATTPTVTLSFLAANTDSMSVTASLVSGPSTSTALPYLRLVETASATVDSATGTAGGAGLYSITNPNNASKAQNLSGAVAVTSAKYQVYLAKGDSLTAPSVAGTYVVKLTPALVSGTTGGGNAAAQTITFTVTAAAALDTVITSATAIITAGRTDSATADQVVTATKAVATDTPGKSTSAVANIKITPKNAAGTVVGTSNSANAGESITVTIAGPGSLGSSTWANVSNGSDQSAAAARGRAITVKAGDFVNVFPDGTSGVATITISSALGVVLATKTVTFFGAPTSIVTTAQATVLNPAANSVDTTDYTTAPIKVVVKDAAGVAVSNLASSLRVTADTTTIVSDSYAANTCSYDNVTGAYYCSLQGVVAGKTKITVGTKTSATDTTATNFNGNAVEVRVGTLTAASVKVATDKTSYAPGEKATLTVTLLDADGNVVAGNGTDTYANIFATGGIATDFVLGSGSDTLTSTSVINVTGGVKTYTIYMPQITGDITFTYKTAGTAVTGTAPSSKSGLAVANQAVTSTFKVAVTNPGVDAATDAANEATDAANAATDAALAAADAADAATAAAQDASDAVAALSATVAKLVASLKAQITSLTNLVIKIQKKVKA